jgi:hypothetical protein
MSGEGAKTYEPLVRIAPAELSRLGLRVNSIVQRSTPTLLAGYRKFRPGWLGHRSYFIVFVEGDEWLEWMRRVAPKIRGKFELRPEQIIDPKAYPASFAGSIYCPTILDEIREEGKELGVTAIRVRHRRVVGRDSITLRYTLGPDGTVGWWGMKHGSVGAMHRLSTELLSELIVGLLGPDHASKVERILTGLGVPEEKGRKVLRAVSSILSERRALQVGTS